MLRLHVQTSRLFKVSVSIQIVHQLFRRDERASLARIFRLLLVLPICVSFCFGDKSTTPFFRFSKGLGIFYVSLITSIVIYRLSPWHPLARYPGPLLCRISKLYWAILTQNGRQYEMLGELHKKYGDIVRIGHTPQHTARWDASLNTLFQAPMKYLSSMSLHSIH